MKILQMYSWRSWLSGLVISSALVLSGCADDGSDGAVGPAGPAAPTSIVKSAVPEKAFSTITSAIVTTNGEVSIEFTVKDADGNGYVGLQSGEFRVIAAQLNPGDAGGDSTYWHRVAYERFRGRTSDVFGTFTDNGDGSYRYTSQTNLKNVTGYNADATHRVGVQLDGDLRPSNATFDFVPSGKLASVERKIVSESACNNCHGQLRIHGGRIATNFCVLCHNPDLNPSDFDPQKPLASAEPSADFKVMVHKIHRGAGLPSVDAGGTYEIGGHDYSEVVLPQDIRNCGICHQESNTATPQASNWRTQPTMEACASCHDNLDFTLPANDVSGNGHPAGPQSDNSGCVDCHGDGAADATEGFHSAVMARKEALRDSFVVQPIAVRVDQVNGDIEVDVSMTLEGATVTALHDGNPANETSAGGKLGKYKYGEENGALAVNWEKASGAGFELNHVEIGLNDCRPNGADFTCASTATGPGLFTGVSDADTLTVTTVDSLLCFNEKDGNVMDCNQAPSDSVRIATIEVTPVVHSYMGDGSDAAAGYDKIGADINACENCHGDKHYHHGATALLQCKTCHNATRSSSSRTIGDLKRHVHRLHSTLDKDALDSPDDDFDDHFPNNIDNCSACHSEGQFDLPLQKNRRPSVARNGVGTTEVYVSPTAVVCGSCHIRTRLGYIDVNYAGYINPASDTDSRTAGIQSPDPIDDAQLGVINHMILNGAVFGGSDAAAATGKEACSVCHAIGRASAVDAVHTLISVSGGSDQ